MASAQVSVSSEQKCNSARLGKLVFKDGVVVLRSLFDRFHAPSTLAAVLRSNYGILRSLLEKQLLSPVEWKLLFPDDASLPSSLNMAPHLLFLLFQNICGLPEPSAGWNGLPSSSCDLNQLQEKLAKLKWLVNEVASRAYSSGIETFYFSVYWNEIFQAVTSLDLEGLFTYSSEELKHEQLNEADKDEYHKLLVDWAAKESDMKDQERVLNITSGGHENIESLKSVLHDQEKIKRELMQQGSQEGNMPFTWDKSSIIGEGCKGTKVYLGNLNSSGKEVAVKRMFRGVFDKDEAEKLRRCKHPNIIRCFATHEEDDFFYLALELCKKTLKMCVDEREFDSVCGDLSLEKCLLQVTSGVVYLHKNKICHRDIKPDNILLVAKNDEYSYQRFVLADFNCARDVPSGQSFSTQHSTVGTPGWMAPEMYLHGKRRTLKVDIFSLGCVFYYTLTNKKHPYGDLDKIDECQDTINKGQMPKFVNKDFGKNTSFIILIKKMVHPDADRRPLASEVYSALQLKRSENAWVRPKDKEQESPDIAKTNNQRHNIPSGGRKVQPKKIILPAQQEVKQLKRSENAWVRSKDKDQESPDIAKTNELYRKVTSILNKLTPQKFQTLMNQILELDIDTPERLEGVIERIFEKAISEPGFSVAYANMCRSLMMIKVRVQIEDKEGKETKEGQISFRKILLNKCQKEFEKEKSEENLVHAQIDALAQQGLTEDELKLKKADLEIQEIKMRRRSLGNIRFIGELFKLKMLTENIMHDCVVKLLRSTDEESYECLCKLLTTIGKDLDHEKAKPRVDQYFEQIKKIVQARRTSSRVRFMMIDVLDLRKNNWVPRREDNNPKTIDQIHKEAQEQEKKTTMMIQQAKLQKRENRGGRESPRNVGVPQADDGWTSVAKGGAKKGDFDPKKFQNISKQRMVDEGNISLGPGGRGYSSWARGSSGGTGSGSAPSAGGPGEQPGNRYSALLSQGDGKRTQGPTRQTGAGRPDVRSPVPPGVVGKRRSSASEREKALEAVRRQTSREGQSKPTYERASSRPGPDAVETVPEPEARASPPVQELSENQIRDKTESTLKEFLNIRDFKEAVQCFKDLKSPSMAHVFVATALESTLEKHESDRRVTGKLFNILLKEGLLTVDQFVKGMDQILEFAEDMEIDVPHIWRYFGELIGIPVAEQQLPLKVLGASLARIQKRSARKMLSDVLVIAVKCSSEGDVGELWANSGLQWSLFFESEEEAKDFLQDKKLDFTLQKSRTSSPAQHTSQIQEELRELILKRKARNQEVFEWIDSNVEAAKTKEAPFIRDLVTAVCEASVSQDGSNTSCKCDQEILKSRKNLLQKYIDGDSKLELQALFALQSLAVTLSHPPGLLKTLFDTLYDEDIISEDSFYLWERCEDSAEVKGKGLALKSTTEFFRWLRSATEESGEEN